MVKTKSKPMDGFLIFDECRKETWRVVNSTVVDQFREEGRIKKRDGGLRWCGRIFVSRLGKKYASYICGEKFGMRIHFLVLSRYTLRQT